MTLTQSECSINASQLYNEIREKDPLVLRIERVRGFRSFVKILNSFDEIQPMGSGVKTYSIKKEYKNGIA